MEFKNKTFCISLIINKMQKTLVLLKSFFKNFNQVSKEKLNDKNKK